MSFSLAHSDGTKQSSLLIPGTCFELPLFAISSPKAINTRTDSSATLKHAVGFATASGDLKLLLSRSIGVLLMSMFYYTNWWSIIRLSYVKCWCCSMHMSIYIGVLFLMFYALFISIRWCSPRGINPSIGILIPGRMKHKKWNPHPKGHLLVYVDHLTLYLTRFLNLYYLLAHSPGFHGVGSKET